MARIGKQRSTSSSADGADAPGLQLHDGVDKVAGVGPRRAETLARAGILTVEDLLLNLPARYEDRSLQRRVADLREGERALVDVTVVSSRRAGPRHRGARAEAVVQDDSGRIAAVWFNQPYLAASLPAGSRVRLWGRPTRFRERLQLVNPVRDVDGAEPSLHVGRPVPVYRRVGDIGAPMLRRLVASALERLDPDDASLPGWVAAERALLPAHEALRQAHYPPAGAPLGAWQARRSDAHRRLVMQEFIGFQTAIALDRLARQREPGRAHALPRSLRERVENALPFALTGAQRRAVDELWVDLQSPAAMHRLLQGDVGSGKTAVAACALLAVAATGEQVALLAPTEILARQHAATLEPWCERIGIRLACLTGATPAAERRTVLADLASGDLPLVVGTHALLGERVRFQRLGLAVIDEQHRFGVGQRAALRRKGRQRRCQPDLLVTTATPIPRSLALTLYGDLEVSRIDEMPPGRATVSTEVLVAGDRVRLLQELRRTVAAGGRAYVVTPRIGDGDEDDDVAAVLTAHEEIAAGLEGVAVELLHGGLPAVDKARAMARFSRGASPVLVATTVIEVGVDVPEATLMVVMDADRFGLAQLHQLRGRVGRGGRPGRCLLLCGTSPTLVAEERLAALRDCNDGFVLAERDLQLRGPGEVLGTRQSGSFGLRTGDPFDTPDWLAEAREVAGRLVAARDPESIAYVEALRATWARRLRMRRAG